jgi:hypothetical protein
MHPRDFQKIPMPYLTGTEKINGVVGFAYGEWQ